MAVIRKYGEYPQVLVPDIGEIVEARRSMAESFIKAVVIKHRRIRSGKIRTTVEWLEDDPHAGTNYPAPISVGDTGRVVFEPDRMDLMIRQITRPTSASD